jgi:hypothetical protein
MHTGSLIMGTFLKFCSFVFNWSAFLSHIHQFFSYMVAISFYWLIDYLLFYVPLKNISLIWRRHHCRWRAAKFRPMLGAQGLWAGRDLHRATLAVTRDLSFSDLILNQSPFTTRMGMRRMYSNRDPLRAFIGGSENTSALYVQCIWGETTDLPQINWQTFSLRSFRAGFKLTLTGCERSSSKRSMS